MLGGGYARGVGLCYGGGGRKISFQTIKLLTFHLQKGMRYRGENDESVNPQSLTDDSHI